MATVRIGQNETFDSGLKRFKRKVETEKIIKEIKKHQEYKKPSVRKKEKRAEAEAQRRRTKSKPRNFTHKK